MGGADCRTNERLELALLGGVLRWPESRHSVRVLLPEDGFSDQARACLWRHLLASWDAGTPPDALTLAERVSVESRGKHWAAIEALEIESWEAYAPGRPEGVDGVAKELAQVALARRCEVAAKRIVSAAADASVTPEALAQLAQNEILRATSEGKLKGPIDALRLAEEYWLELEARMSRGEVSGLSTGLLDLDKMARLESGKLWIAAGRPGMGKSAYAGHLSLSVARQEKTVLVFSLEMPRTEWIERLACTLAGVDSQDIRAARLNADAMRRMSSAINTIAQLPLLIDDTEDLTLWQMRSRAIAAKAQHPNLGLIVVDYLQLVRADLDNRNANREQEVSVISRAGKALSKQLDCTLLMLAQLNRACEARSDKRPMMSDLRESGAIEQDADVVTFLYRDEVYNKSTSDAGVAEVLVAKNRSGVCGTVRTKFDARFTRFADLEEEPVAPAPRRNVPATRDPREPSDYDF